MSITLSNAARALRARGNGAEGEDPEPDQWSCSVVPSVQSDDDGDEDEATYGGESDGAHHLGALLGCLLGPLSSLEDALGVVERGLDVGDLRLGVLDRFLIHDTLLRLAGIDGFCAG